MRARNRHLLGFSLSVLLLSVIAGARSQQAPPGQPKGDGLLRSELSLGGRTATLAYAPDLRAGDPTSKALLSTTPPVGVRMRVGQLDTTGTLRIGTIDLGRQERPAGRQGGAVGRQPAAGAGQAAVEGAQGPVPVRYDLWLEGANTGWQIQIIDADKSVVGQTALARKAAAAASPTLVAALVPEDRTLGRLLLRWGDYEAMTDVQFTSPSRRRIEDNRGVNVTTRRRHDEDTSALSRSRLLAQRNETAFVLPKGARLSVAFERTFARGERAEGGQNTRGLGVEGPDFAALMKTPNGAIVTLTESSVPRLSTDVPLRFGKTVLRTGNQVVGFPGAYGVWLKRVASGWRLVFNNEPDVWGSQHDPKFDAAEIVLTHSEGDAASRPFAVALVPTAPDRGRLVIIWGPHEWAAEFVAAG